MRYLLAVSSLLAFSAFAAQPESAAAPTEAAAASGASTQTAAAAAAPKIVCHRVTPTGSTIPHNVCEREDAGRDQQLTNDLANDAMRNRQMFIGSRGG